MDRQTVYFGQLARETDVLLSQQNTMVALAKLAAGVLGTNTIVNAFACIPTTPASLNVNLTAGEVYQIENLEQTQWSSASPDTLHSILKQGIQLNPVTLAIAPPVAVGYSQVYLIEVQYADVDGGSTVLPYYNAANPNSPFLGPGNAGTAQNTVRQGAVAVQIKAGVAATTGTQVAPTADAGWTGLFLVTASNGQSTITAGNIVQIASAPFIPVTLPAVPAGVQSGVWEYSVDTGVANAMVANVTPVPTQLTPGMMIRVKAGFGNAGPATLNLNGLGVFPIHRANGAGLSSGDYSAGQVLTLAFDGAAWQIINYFGFTSSTTNNNTFTLTIPYVADTGTTDAIIANYSPAITTLAAGMNPISVKLANAVTGATTINVNGLGAVAVVNQFGQPLAANDVVAGEILFLFYNGTSFQTAGGPPRASLTAGQLNLTGSAPGGAKTASWTASEIIAETALGGLGSKGANVALNFNGAGAGAGGMDIGSTPASADLYIYAIFNPTASTWNTLGTIACNGPTYTAANMPSGYTASWLIWSGKTDSASNVAPFFQIDRTVSIVSTNCIAGGAASSWTAVSISTIVPANAKTCSGFARSYPGQFEVADAPGNFGQQILAGTVNEEFEPFTNLRCVGQIIYYQLSGSTTSDASISKYTF